MNFARKKIEENGICTRSVQQKTGLSVSDRLGISAKEEELGEEAEWNNSIGSPQWVYIFLQSPFQRLSQLTDGCGLLP